MLRRPFCCKHAGAVLWFQGGKPTSELMANKKEKIGMVYFIFLRGVPDFGGLNIYNSICLLKKLFFW